MIYRAPTSIKNQGAWKLGLFLGDLCSDASGVQTAADWTATYEIFASWQCRKFIQFCVVHLLPCWEWEIYWKLTVLHITYGRHCINACTVYALQRLLCFHCRGVPCQHWHFSFFRFSGILKGFWQNVGAVITTANRGTDYILGEIIS